MDMTGWTAITGADGSVLGWMAPADGETPLERAHRIRAAGMRAQAVGEVADLAASAAFDLDDVCETGEARIGEHGVDAALGVAYELMQIEQLRQ